MKQATSALLTAVILLAGQFIALPSNAEVQEYQIRRLVLFKSECKILTVSRSEPETGGYNFHIDCENVSFYPEGLNISCSDKDLETSCKILTKSKKFDLEFLKRSVNNDHHTHDKKQPEEPEK